MNEPKSVREMVESMQLECRNSPDLFLERAAEMLVQLSSLLGNCNDEILKRDMEYSKILLLWLEKESKANRAKITAETTKEYQARCIARNTKELAVELIRSLRSYLKSKEEELQKAKYQ